MVALHGGTTWESHDLHRCWVVDGIEYRYTYRYNISRDSCRMHCMPLESIPCLVCTCGGTPKKDTFNVPLHYFHFHFNLYILYSYISISQIYLLLPHVHQLVSFIILYLRFDSTRLDSFEYCQYSL